MLDIIKESDVSVSLLVERLSAAFFEVSDIQEDNFDIIIHSYNSTIYFNETRKTLRLNTSWKICDYHPELFKKMLEAVNEANSNIVNVCNYISHHHPESDDIILLVTDQTVSYKGGLILPQFVALMRDFESISEKVYDEYMMPAYKAFEAESVPSGTLLN